MSRLRWGRDRRATRTAIGLVAAAALSVGFAGCDETAPGRETTSRAPAEFGQDKTAEIGWIKQEDDTDPAWWLASREAANDPSLDRKAAASELRALLEDARRNFMETPRMIANRAVQLEGTLAEKGVHERARDILVAFNGTKNPGITSRRFGDICQHYATLRSQGMNGPQALAALSGHDEARRTP